MLSMTKWRCRVIIGVCFYLAYGETKTCTSTWDSQRQVWRERCSDGSRETWRYDDQSQKWYGRQWQAPRDGGNDGKAEKREKGAR
jgi:hypothetical protein